MGGIDETVLARVVHVLGVVHWIGGVAFVTLVALPLARAFEDPARGFELFHRIERGFSAQVRVSIALVGASGLWMTYRLDLWARFSDPAFWWMGAMAALWALFALIVYLVEPLAHERIAREAARDPRRLLDRLARVHFVLLGLAAIVIFGAVAGAHGGF
jgi:uncharacterized membrane protein